MDIRRIGYIATSFAGVLAIYLAVTACAGRRDNKAMNFANSAPVQLEVNCPDGRKGAGEFCGRSMPAIMAFAASDIGCPDGTVDVLAVSRMEPGRSYVCSDSREVCRCPW